MTASVFAQRAADKAAPKSAGKGSRQGPTAAASKAGAPPARPKPAAAGAPYPAAAKASIAAPRAPGSQAEAPGRRDARDEDKDSGGEAGGGIVTCANSKLLQQMLQGLEEQSDGPPSDIGDQEEADRDPFSMSSRLTPSTPLAGQHSVPTIRSPAASKARPPGPGTTHAVGGKPSPPAPKPKAVITGGASTGVAVRAAAFTGGVSTTIPSSGAYVSGPRPGSRGAGGGGVPQPFVSPASKNGVKRISIAPGPTRSAAAAPRGYAGLHAQRAKQPASPALQGPAGKPAAKPLSGPKAFDLLRRLDQGEDVEVPRAAPSTVDRLKIEEEGDDEGDAFVMPPDSDPESEDAHKSEPVGAETLQGRPRPLPLTRSSPTPPGVAAQGQQALAKADTLAPGGGRGGDGAAAGEGPAEYVERMRRDLQLQTAARPADSQGHWDSPASSAVPSGRGQGGEVLGRWAPAQPAGSGARASSHEPRARAAAPVASDNEDDDEDEDEQSDEIPVRTAGAMPAWKADVRQFTQDVAGRDHARPRGGATAAVPHGRPPRPTAAASPGMSSSPGDPLGSRKPRAVDYTPATVDDYKKKYSGQELKMGNLGPDLDDEKLLMKKAVAEKVKQFSKELHKVNRQRSTSVPARPQPKPEPKPTARSKALEFAKELPKPKPKPKPPERSEVPKRQDETAQDREDWDEIRQREIQHFEDVARAEQIKHFLAQVVV